MPVVRACVVWLVVLFLVGTVAARAQNAEDGPIVVDKADLGALSFGGTASQLLAKAQQQGTIRVIAGLKLAMTSEDDLTPAAQAGQAARLDAMQDDVLGHVLGRNSGDGITRFSYIPYVAMSVTSGQLARALNDPRIANIEEDVLFAPQGYNIRITNAAKVVRRGFDGTGQTVAIVDTGIDETSAEFTGRIVAEACYSTNSSTSKSFCPGHAASSTAPGSGKNCTTAIGDCAHGTEMASAAVGAGTLQGFAPGASIITIQIFSKVTSGGKCTTSAPCAQAFMSDQVKALEHVYSLRKTFNIAAANLSVGHGSFNAVCDLKFQSLATIITKLRHANILTTTPAGNAGTAGSIMAPACISTAIAVGSSDKTDILSTFSNFSSQLTVIAPGTGVRVTEPGDTTHDKSGTSIAAAEVAGAAAVAFNSAPGATANAVSNSFQCGVVGITDTGLPNVTVQRLDVLTSHNYLTKPPSSPQTWTFSNAADGKLWTPFLGTWDTADGNYNLVTPAVTPQPWNGSWFPNCAGGVDVTATMTRGDDDPNTGWNSGILFDAIVDQTTLTASGYYFAYNKQKLPNTTSPAGEAVLMRFDSFLLSNIIAYPTYLCPYAPAPVNIGGSNTVRVVSNAGTITVYVNGTQFCSVVDTTYPSGLIMLLAAYPSPTTAGQSLAINQVKIKTLPPPSPPPGAVDASVTPHHAATSTRTGIKASPLGATAF